MQRMCNANGILSRHNVCLNIILYVELWPVLLHLVVITSVRDVCEPFKSFNNYVIKQSVPKKRKLLKSLIVSHVNTVFWTFLFYLASIGHTLSFMLATFINCSSFRESVVSYSCMYAWWCFFTVSMCFHTHCFFYLLFLLKFVGVTLWMVLWLHVIHYNSLLAGLLNPSTWLKHHVVPVVAMPNPQ